MKLGPYRLNHVYTGDALELAEVIPNGSIDLIFTSPPYYNAKEYAQYKTYSEYLGFIESFLEFSHRILNKDGIFVLNTSPIIVPRKARNSESQRLPIPFDCFNIAQRKGFKYIDDIIWQKPDGASNRAIKFAHHRRPVAYKPFVVTEYLFVFRRNDAPLIDEAILKHPRDMIEASLVPDGYERTNIWSINPVTNSWHPAPFPLELAERVVRYYSFIGDVVFDPFAGSGTVPVACKMLNRNSLAFERDVRFVSLTRQRIANTQPYLI